MESSSPGSREKLRTALLRLLIVIGLVITPVWLGILLWLVIRAAQWLIG